jgi:transposase-like protein
MRDQGMQQDRTVRRRRRRSTDEKASLLDAWRRSGLSAREFSRREGLQKTSLWRWSRELGQVAAELRKPKDLIAFAPVHVANAAPKPVASAERVVAEVLVRDVRIRVLAGADAVQVADLVKALTGGRSC